MKSRHTLGKLARESGLSPSTSDKSVTQHQGVAHHGAYGGRHGHCCRAHCDWQAPQHARLKQVLLAGGQLPLQLPLQQGSSTGVDPWRQLLPQGCLLLRLPRLLCCLALELRLLLDVKLGSIVGEPHHQEGRLHGLILGKTQLVIAELILRCGGCRLLR